MKKKRLIVLTGLFVLLIFASSAFGAEYWASKNAKTYHDPTCRIAKKINPKNLVKFAEPALAVKAEYQPCKICKPPLPQ